MSATVGSATSSLSIIRDRVRPAEGRVYLNPNNRAPTSGTVYSWTLCYSPDNDSPPYELVFAMYRHKPDGTCQLVTGSYRELTITTPLGNSFDCRNIDLSTSEFFTVQRDDVVAVCAPINARRVEIFFEDDGNHLNEWIAGSCSEDRISSTGRLTGTQGTTFLLQASISETHYYEYTN